MSQLTTEEMVDDYWASKKDAELCEWGMILDVEYEGIEHRARTNRAIMDMIEKELDRRGELGRIGKEGDSDGRGT